jgi:hypothetical protein
MILCGTLLVAQLVEELRYQSLKFAGSIPDSVTEFFN